MYGFYAWQPYVLDLLGEHNAVWLLGVVQAGFSAAGIVGNTLSVASWARASSAVDPGEGAGVGTWIERRAGGRDRERSGFLRLQPGVVPAAIAIVLWLGLRSRLRGHGPGEDGLHQRAHPLGAARDGAVARLRSSATLERLSASRSLGWVSRSRLGALAWLIGGVFMAAAAPLYRRSGGAAAASGEAQRATNRAERWCPGWESNPHALSDRGF